MIGLFPIIFLTVSILSQSAWASLSHGLAEELKWSDLHHLEKLARWHFDANGNLTSLPLTANSSLSCTWDARDRLVQIQQSTANGLQLTTFEYDGLGRRTRIAKKLNGSLTSDKYFVFDGLAMVEERDGNGNVVKQFFDQGVKILTGPNAGTYFYTRDHEGNIREIINSAGVVVARYDYDSYGRMTLVSGVDLADFGFQGMYVLRVPGMAYPVNLTWKRVYDPDLGRWWSRDEIESVNQYPGMGNNAINYVDPLGLVEVIPLTYEQSEQMRQNAEGQVESALKGIDTVLDALEALPPNMGGPEVKEARVGINEAKAAVAAVGTTVVKKWISCPQAAKEIPKDTTYLYQKIGALGEHLKFGITKNLAIRYSSIP